MQHVTQDLMRVWRILAIVATLFIVPAAAGQQAVSGRVLAEDALGLNGVDVTLQNLNDSAVVFRVRTDFQGRYSFPEVPDGEYFLEAAMRGLVGVRLSPIRVEFPLQVRKDFVLVVAPGTEGPVQLQAEVAGELTWKGQRLSHANICLRREGAEFCRETNGIGQHYLAVKPGRYEAVVSAQGKTLWTGPLDASRPGTYRNKIQPMPNP